MTSSTFIPGPDAHLDLVYSDVWLPAIYSRRIFCFELPACSSHERAIEVLQRGLQSLVQGTPQLGGQSVVLPRKNGEKVHWKAIRPYKGIELVVKDLTQSFHGYDKLEETGFPIYEFKDGLLVPAPVAPSSYPAADMIVQATLIEGGLLLAVCVCHDLTDGNGMNAIVKALGEQCTLAGETTETLAPRKLDTDRTIMLELTGSKTDLKDHPAYGFLQGAYVPKLDNLEKDSQPLNDHSSAAAHELEHKSEEATTAEPNNQNPPQPQIHTWRITGAIASALKQVSATASAVSTHDAIAALMWRTVTIARVKAGRLSMDKVSTYTIPHNARRHVGLSKDWVGNCCYFISVSLPVSQIIESDSLPKIASAIRASLNAVNSDVVGGLMELRKPCTYDITWWPLHQVNEAWILMLTSFYHSELYGSDWGRALGKVKHFTTSNEGALGGFRSVGFVGPRLPGDGCDVTLGLSDEEYEFVQGDEVWRKYTKELAS